MNLTEVILDTRERRLAIASDVKAQASLVVQWRRLCTSTAGGALGQGSKISHASIRPETHRSEASHNQVAVLPSDRNRKPCKDQGCQRWNLANCMGVSGLPGRGGSQKNSDLSKLVLGKTLVPVTLQNLNLGATAPQMSRIQGFCEP